MATKRKGVEANELGNDPIDQMVDEKPAPFDSEDASFDDEPFKTDTSRERNNDDPVASTEGNAPSQPEDTSDVKADAEAESSAATSDATSAEVEQNAPDQEQPAEPGQPQAITDGLPEGLSVQDILWWNNSQNRNYMAGDGPEAGITEIDGTAQSSSSVDPEVRAKTLEESRKSEDRNATTPTQAVEG